VDYMPNQENQRVEEEVGMMLWNDVLQMTQSLSWWLMAIYVDRPYEYVDRPPYLGTFRRDYHQDDWIVMIQIDAYSVNVGPGQKFHLSLLADDDLHYF
jgi:hypothetical protein